MNLYQRRGRVHHQRLTHRDTEVLVYLRVANLAIQVVWNRTPFGDTLFDGSNHFESWEDARPLTETTLERERRLTEGEERPPIPVVANGIERRAQLKMVFAVEHIVLDHRNIIGRSHLRAPQHLLEKVVMRLLFRLTHLNAWQIHRLARDGDERVIPDGFEHYFVVELLPGHFIDCQKQTSQIVFHIA